MVKAPSLGIIDKRAIFILKLGRMTIKDTLSLMEILAFEECTAAVCAFVLISDDSSFENRAKSLEIVHDIFVFPHSGNLTNE